MKIKELIEALSLFPQEREVIMARDPEGNGYSPLSDIDRCLYLPETSYSGEIFDEQDKTEFEDAVPAIVLWPIN